METREVKVPVPWGHIAVKIWGNEQNPAVLVTHGILDNAGAMGRLLRLLPACFCYYAIDLPGHGRSSHWPACAMVHAIDQLLVLRAVMAHFMRGRYVVLGHSWGGQLGLLYALVYPEMVRKLVMLDTLFLRPITSANFCARLRHIHDKYFAGMAGRAPPAYSREEALHRLMNQRIFDKIERAPAEDLLERCALPTSDGKLVLTTDQRLKYAMGLIAEGSYVGSLLDQQPPQCPVLLVLASHSQRHLADSSLASLFNQLMQMPNVTIAHVAGSHDVHMNHPERMAGHIARFLLQPDADATQQPTPIGNKL